MELFGTTGQERRAWLDGIDAQISEALRYYLGPTGIDKKVNALAQVAPMFMDGTDVVDAQAANDRFWASPSVPNALALAAPMAALAVPGVSNRLAQGMADTGADLVDAGQRFVRDEYGGLALPGGETAAQKVAAMLREGRASEVTDDMMAAVDPTEMAELYARGMTGVEMPLDDASRMQRARDMGFDTRKKMYHGTGRRFESFDESMQRDPGVWLTSDISNAANYADADGDLIEAFTRKNNPESVLFDYDEDGRLAPFFRGEASDISDNAEFVKMAKRNGADAVVFPDGNFTESGYTEVILDPRNIRRTSARFDPRLSHLGSLSASMVPLIFGANALAMDDEKQQIRDYLGGM